MGYYQDSSTIYIQLAENIFKQLEKNGIVIKTIEQIISLIVSRKESSNLDIYNAQNIDKIKQFVIDDIYEELAINKAVEELSEYGVDPKNYPIEVYKLIGKFYKSMYKKEIKDNPTPELYIG